MKENAKVTDDDETQREIARLERLFPFNHGWLPFGREAFRENVPDDARMERVATLIKDLRKEGDVRIVLVRGMGKPRDEFVVAVQEPCALAVVPEPEPYMLRLSEMLQTEQKLRHKAEAEVAALKRKLKRAKR